MEQLLTTKLYIPPTRPGLVPRPRLIERMNEGLSQNQVFGRKLTLISAPAGFGKTTLVSEWVGNLRLNIANENQIENRIAWLSLDEGDNDPTRFLTYFIAALNQGEGFEAALVEGALSMLQSPQPPPTEAILTALINEIAALPDRIILILDDYHLIDSQPIHDALTFLIEHLPANLHLVIATRDDPYIPLGRLRARGQLNELRAADLRFTSSEAAKFLNQVMGLDLSVEDIAALEARTEGWIAGLQLAAISMQRHKDPASLIKSFTGSHRFVMDYLIEEVLEQQSEYVQTFLLLTSILDRLTGSLCNTLTDQDNGKATLEIIERTNLFIIPLDEERRWYRYHHLFADLLRQRLKQSQPKQLPILHRRASEWYEHNGFAGEAIEHALRGEDFERAARLIEEQVDALWQLGEHAKLTRWMAGLPDELLFSKPQLCIYHAWYLFASGQYDAGERSLRVAEEALEPRVDRVVDTSPLDQVGQQSDVERAILRGRASAIRASMASYRGDVPGIIQHARRALDYLPEQEVSMRSTAAIALGNAYGFRGDMAAAYQARLGAVEASKSGGNTYFSILAHLEVAITLREQGRLQQTLEICQQQVQLADKSGLSQASVAGCLLAIWGETLAEQGDLESAVRQTKRGVERTKGGDLAMLGWSYLCLMRVLFSTGDMAAAQESIQKIERIDRKSDIPPWITAQMAAWQARLWLAQGKLEAASQWVEVRGLLATGEPKPLHEMDYFLLIEYVVLARILIAQERLDETTALLQRLLEAAEMGERTTRMIEILLLQALTFQAGRDTTQAVAALEQALNLAQPDGFIRIFVDEGPPMARLLYEALNHGITPDYVRQLLSAFPITEPNQSEPLINPDTKIYLIKPLSEREIEVLQLIAEGLTNQNIASRLYLSLNTVKVHIRNIYGKLGVSSRTQAVARATALGILAST